MYSLSQVVPRNRRLKNLHLTLFEQGRGHGNTGSMVLVLTC